MFEEIFLDAKKFIQIGYFNASSEDEKQSTIKKLFKPFTEVPNPIQANLLFHSISRYHSRSNNGKRKEKKNDF